MAIDTVTPRTRRAILIASLGGLAATVAAALGRPRPARADNGDNLVLGTNNTADATTTITKSASGGVALRGLGSGAGTGLYGSSPSGAGVVGFATGSAALGVQGWATQGAGVTGHSGALSPPAAPAKTGVYGHASQDATAVGVRGSSSTGDAIVGTSDAATKSGVWGSNNGGGYGVAGSTNGTTTAGVWGSSGGATGVRGTSVTRTGLLGYSGPGSAPAAPAKTGVYGEASQDASSRGVWGGTGTGAAVYGLASDFSGYAFRGSGRVRFDKVSGLATMAAGTTSKTITPGTNVTNESFVLLTPMNDLGGRRLWFTRNTTANTIKIHMSSTRGSSTRIAWLLLS